MIVREREMARADTLPGELGSEEVTATRVRWKPMVWTASVAAAAAAVAVIMTAQFDGDTAKPSYWIPVNQEAAVLRSASDADGRHDVGSALDRYELHDAAGAIAELKALEPPPGDETTKTLRGLFLASALVNSGRYEEAEATLLPLNVDSMPTQWRREARWVRYLALSQLGRDAEARQILDKLVTEPGEIGRLAQAEAKRIR